MKTKQQIEDKIKGIKDLLNNRDKQIDPMLDIEYLKLKTYKNALEWVLNFGGKQLKTERK